MTTQLTNTDVCIRMSLSFLCGIIIGLERQFNNRNAGIHTHVLVSLGSCLFIFVGIGLGDTNSPSRIAAQVVTGIGFLCSGIILKDNNSVKNINTSTTIWCTSSIGCLCGCGLWLTGLCASIMISIFNFLLRDATLKVISSILKNESVEYETKDNERNINED